MNLSLVKIVLKYYYYLKSVKNIYLGQNKLFFLGSASSAGSAGSAVPRSVVAQISDTPLYALCRTLLTTTILRAMLALVYYLSNLSPILPCQNIIHFLQLFNNQKIPS